MVFPMKRGSPLVNSQKAQSIRQTFLVWLSLHPFEALGLDRAGTGEVPSLPQLGWNQSPREAGDPELKSITRDSQPYIILSSAIGGASPVPHPRGCSIPQNPSRSFPFISIPISWLPLVLDTCSIYPVPPSAVHWQPGREKGWQDVKVTGRHESSPNTCSIPRSEGRRPGSGLFPSKPDYPLGIGYLIYAMDPPGGRGLNHMNL